MRGTPHACLHDFRGKLTTSTKKRTDMRAHPTNLDTRYFPGTSGASRSSGSVLQRLLHAKSPNAFRVEMTRKDAEIRRDWVSRTRDFDPDPRFLAEEDESSVRNDGTLRNSYHSGRGLPTVGDLYGDKEERRGGSRDPAKILRDRRRAEEEETRRLVAQGLDPRMQCPEEVRETVRAIREGTYCGGTEPIFFPAKDIRNKLRGEVVDLAKEVATRQMTRHVMPTPDGYHRDPRKTHVYIPQRAKRHDRSKTVPYEFA